MRPARERTEKWKCEGEIELKLESRREARLGLPNHPVAKQQEYGRENHEVIHGEMWRQQNGCEQQRRVAQAQGGAASPAGNGHSQYQECGHQVERE